MFPHHLVRSVARDRDLTRAAADRYAVLEALSERKASRLANPRLARLATAVRR